MSSINRFKEKLFDIALQDFNEAALELFEYQSNKNGIYKKYLSLLGINRNQVSEVTEIPFLPIDFFKYHEIKTGEWTTSKVFLSSGTTLKKRSQHHIKDLDFYKEVSLRIFESRFGETGKWKILALLPSYLEQGDSSLICMVDHLIQRTQAESKYIDLSNPKLDHMFDHDQVMLIGVTYALIDFVEATENIEKSPVILETGGMKGRKREITRNELIETLSKVSEKVYTEYGMTELFSQAYGKKGELQWPNWCRSLIRDINDPFKVTEKGTGGLNIIDLANIDTCAFIETKDIGTVDKYGQFEVLGRMDNSDIRGCSLLI